MFLNHCYHDKYQALHCGLFTVNLHCRLCISLSKYQTPAETMEHLLTRCKATSDTRDGKLPDLLNIVARYSPSNRLLTNPAHSQLTQFILDCTSLNLSPETRISPSNPGFISITRQCSSLVYALHNDRKRQLKAMGLLH